MSMKGNKYGAHRVIEPQGVLTQAELLAHRLPEMPASLVPIIEDIWLTDVVGK